MSSGMLESDWKLFRQLQPVALERFCQRALDDVNRKIASKETNYHKRYLAVFHLLKERETRLADAFNDPRRSAALVQLARIRFEKLLTEEEFARFSEGARASVQVFLNMWRG